MLDSYSACSSIWKMEVIHTSETSVDFQWTTWPYIPEDNTLQMYIKFCKGNLKERDHLEGLGVDQNLVLG
jgi:hypothetical protein